MIETLKRPMSATQVLETKDYDMFKFVRGNRKIRQTHLHRLRRSIKSKYLFTIIMVNERYEIIDGQHRFILCKELNLPVYYVVVKGYGLDEVKILNTNTYNWKKMDYLEAYCDLGYQEYIKFREYMETFPEFGISSCELILGYTNKLGRKEITKKSDKDRSYYNLFEEGEFVCVDLELSYRWGNMLMELKPYYDGFKRRAFISAMIDLFKNNEYDHDELIRKLSLQPRAMTDCINQEQYKDMIEEIYNYKRRMKINLRY